MIAAVFWRIVAAIVTAPGIRGWIVARASRTPYSDIYGADGKSLYMRRFWLFNPYDNVPGGNLRRFAWLPLSIRVHHIIRPDEDRHLHDHPWNYRTVILDGTYAEMRSDGKQYRRETGDTAEGKHNDFHKITWVDPVIGAVTLFITFRYRGTWGFKVPYREYLGLDPKGE